MCLSTMNVKKENYLMANFSERLKELRKEKGFTQKELAKRIGFSYQNLQKYEKGTARPLNKNLVKLSKILGVSTSYLLGEEKTNTSELDKIVSQLHESRQDNTLAYAKKQLIEQNEEINDINQLFPYEVVEEQALSAGLGEGYTDSSNKEIVYWDRDFDYDYAIFIKGESMEPDFYSGEVALIKKQDTIDYPGQVCAVDDTERGKAYLKCVSVINNGMWLQSLNDTRDEDGNKLFPDIFLPFEENPRIIGVVKEHFFPVQIR